MGAREILLLAAEDAFEFERWREAGPVTAEIDPETSAAEIVEYEALGIPLPRELDVLRRELEFAPAVREAIRSSTSVLRRNGRAEASALVGLGPQGLMPWGAGGMDPRLLMMMDPRLGLDPRLAGDPRVAAQDPRQDARGRSGKSGRAGRAAVIVEPELELEREPFEPSSVRGVAVEPELVDEPDDDADDQDEDDDDFVAPARQRRASPAPALPFRFPELVFFAIAPADPAAFPSSSTNSSRRACSISAIRYRICPRRYAVAFCHPSCAFRAAIRVESIRLIWPAPMPTVAPSFT